jgi:hypothetical protein
MKKRAKHQTELTMDVHLTPNLEAAIAAWFYMYSVRRRAYDRLL